MRKLLEQEELLEEKEKKFFFSHLFTDNWPLVKTYLGIFTGVFFTYLLAAIILPQIGLNTTQILREQLFLDPVISGRATFDLATFSGILLNNWLVLLVTFLLAVLVGDGAIFFVAWNASAWGAIFGTRALLASTIMEPTALVLAATLLVFVIWHSFIEGLAYIVAAISGAIISQDAVRKEPQSKELPVFLTYLFGATILYVLLSSVSSGFPSFIRFIFLVGVVIALLYGLSYAFHIATHRRVFMYNYWLFIVAIAIFILGVLVETIVLSSSTTVSQIYLSAQMAS